MADMLFDIPEPPARKPDISPDRRRTQRQLHLLTIGRHPLTLVLPLPLPLHPEAAPVDDRDADGRRCGNCRFRELIGWHDRSWPKCTVEMPYASPDALLLRITHGAGTDVRAWWPACIDHEWGDSLSEDAARCIPAQDAKALTDG